MHVILLRPNGEISAKEAFRPLKGYMKHLSFSLFSLVLLTIGCPENADQGPTSEVRFILTNGNPSFADFLDVPWPSDFHRQDGNENTVDMRAFPNPTNSTLLDTYVETFQLNATGYSGVGSQYFYSPEGIDADSVPQTPKDSIEDGATLFLVELDNLDTKIPVEIKVYDRDLDFVKSGTVAVRPLLGLHTIKPTALVVTNKVKNAEGGSLTASEDMKKMMACEPVETTLYVPDCKRYQKVLDGIGLDADEVALISLLTPQDPTADFLPATEKMIESYGPEVRNIEFMGDSWQTANYYAYKGELKLENYQKGNAPFNKREDEEGRFVFDDEGAFAVQSEEWAPFSLTVPKYEMPENGWPIAVYGHGTGGSRLSPLGDDDGSEAYLLAKAGWAVITIAEPLHRSRDGYQEGNEEINTFNFFNPWSSRHTWLMSTLEKIQQVSAVTILDVPSIDGAPEARFDLAHIGFIGHSQGGIVGAMLAPLDERIECMFLSGAGAGFTDSMTGKFEPVDIPGVLIMALDLDDVEELDVFHPLMTMMQFWIDPADPIHYGQLWHKGTGFAQPHLLATSGLKDKYTPVPTHHGLAGSFRLPIVEPVADMFPVVDILGLTAQEPPLQGNLVLGNGVVRTAGMVQYPQNGHFAIYENSGAQALIHNFFETMLTNDDPWINLRW